MPDSIYILCGGTSTRMGQDKAQLSMDNQTMLNRLVERCRKYFDSCILLSGRSNYNLQLKQIPDYLPGAGPLSAMVSAMKHHTGSCFVILPVDMPLIENATLRFLSRVQLPNQCDALIGSAQNRNHPLAGIYSTRQYQNLKDYLDEGGRSVRGFLERLSVRTYRLTERESLNANTPEEYHKAVGLMNSSK